ncbi:MAG TPA: amidohydrolase/deacetylase family metallohydrolase [Gammaproteobacteria bacterium]|nr:amidohydrolase/deacetylase family metallohydrolase [Gammaproteobacteria bacterium]
MNRREFVWAAASAALVSGVRPLAAQAARYDLIIRGGRVIDPSLRLDAVRDVGIAAGRIAAVEPTIGAAAAATLDARGKLVVPGLIDIHTHAARDAAGPALCLRDGVTCFIDAGSAGADNLDAAVAITKAAPQTGRILVNIGRQGILPDGDTKDLALADVGAARAAIERHRDYVVGIKARLSETVVGKNDVEVLKRAQQVAEPLGLPIMIHMGQSPSSLRELLPILKSGDIVTHMFAPPPNAVVDDAGRLLPEVLAARRRGIVFDVGNGVRDHIRWDIVEQVMRQGFWPDTFSTDWNVMSGTTGVVDFPNCMSKLFGYGMSVPEAIACATVNAAKTFESFRDRGTLNVGAPADVAVLELREGEFEFVDNYENKIKGRQRLFPSETVLAGKRVPRA